ncbi:MAG: hypothetical protein ACOYOE_07190 [Chlorobium sp.]
MKKTTQLRKGEAIEVFLTDDSNPVIQGKLDPRSVEVACSEALGRALDLD